MPFDGISKFRPRRPGVSLGAQFLKRSFAPKVMNQGPFHRAEAPANYREIPSGWSMGEKLSNERIPIRLGFRKEQNPGRKPIDAMHHKSSLSRPSKRSGKKRPGGRSIRALHRHSRQSGRLIEDEHGIVFVKHGKLP